MKTRHFIILATLTLLFAACRQEEVIYVPEQVVVTQPELTDVSGFYLLNEGNMNSNKASLDYYDYATGTYTRDIYADVSPDVVKALGDVGNDIATYGNKLYIVVNCSNKIEVLDRNTARRITHIDIPNCRYIKFHGGYAYVTSYAGPVKIDINYEQRGYVAKIDTATLQVVDTCVVGFQPDELDIVNDKIYVANSGGYLLDQQSGNSGYETTVSVIDLPSFTEQNRIDIAPNLQYCRADRRGILWISSRGDYYETPGRLIAYDTRHNRVVKTIDLAVASMWMDGDSLYVLSGQWSYIGQTFGSNGYSIVNTKSMEIVCDNFITDGTDARITRPYGIAVNPVTKEIYVTDARGYIVPGRLYCFSPDGKRRWDVRTGDIPAHFAFIGRNKNEH